MFARRERFIAPLVLLALTIGVHWTSAAPEVMETQIVNPIEQAVISVQGVQDIESNMRQGTATIKLTFQTSKDIDAALQETNSKLRSVALPSDVLDVYKRQSDKYRAMRRRASPESFRHQPCACLLYTSRCV